MYDKLLFLFYNAATSANETFSVKTAQLLNQICNESQSMNIMKRDACYGCFFRASAQPSGYPVLLSMAACADTYLNNTDYGHCQMYLRVYIDLYYIITIFHLVSSQKIIII